MVSEKSITDPEGTLVLCRSALRCEKEAAMLFGTERHMLNAAALRTRIETGKLKDPAKIEHAIVKPSQPDAEQQHHYDKPGIDWKATFPAIKTTTTH